MHSLAHRALLGSLIAAAAGAIVLAAITVQHGLKRGQSHDDEQPAEAIARRQRLVPSRRCGGGAVLRRLGRARPGGTDVPDPRGDAGRRRHDDSALAERPQAIEKRVATAELELQTRGGSAAPEWRAWEERIARLESRLGAVEERTAAVAARREERPRAAAPAAPRQVAPATTAPRSVPPAKRAAPPQASASPRLSPPDVTAEAVEAPKPQASAPVAAAAPVVAPPPLAVAPAAPAVTPPSLATAPAPPAVAPPPSREPARPRAEEPPSGNKLVRDWDAIKRHAQAGDEWRDGWDQLKRLFGY